ncbi:beta-N-acetylglucosaminidase domain-containing protein [Clostridium perfringens]|uniref:Beta-N-acetylglucosaminidase domain-containing protein n=1 Tax=Clostridium perfringens TaxID=1502 RepID=A0AAN5NCZ2_CLOPF|nr:beta-N-acetylglucosaminidase domain-containing protein [Clostridium perfringens]AQW27091.1 hyaluronidase [Clostridium perfringens]KAB8119020.1 hyaluronidase [Clostridium perfringens]KQC92573.1 hyaluronidase [Clostridium perfringens CP4]MBO3336473.1 beta-N-acetylglucosaminidase domain-containing protein [Clostridium perfringens]MBO3383501.1 beta-N-acetylglucosaminidase domain-containing protein [Clostridium perfringens]
MNKKKIKKLIKSALATTCAVSVITTTSVTAFASNSGENSKEEESNKRVEAEVYPVPQSLEHSSIEGMTLEGEVNIVYHGEQEAATSKRLERTLNENNIAFKVSENVEEGKANIIVSSEWNHCDVCSEGKEENSDVLTHKEGYVLKTSNDINEKGNISIIGSDKDGAYYGVLTLSQILEQSNEENKFAEVVVTDYPEIEFRGFIEGFYGVPWSHEDRMNLMKDTSEYKMNTYIYAPKDDPYHRLSWKELYPEQEAKQIAELAKAGAENNFNFCWTIHPGATLQFTDEDFDALINKFEQLYSLGVRQFGVLFDDTDDWRNGQKQAEWINKIDTEFVKAKGDVAPMIVISARYNSAWGPNMDRYFKPFMQTLHDDIQVMWTGHATMSNVSKEVFEWPKVQTGVDKDVAVWWNYPVNDYCDSRILMAPLHNLNQDLDNVSGFFSNPMNQAEASKVALYSIADYTWNTDAFDYMKSWETSIEKFVPEVKEEFMRFASNTCYLKDDGGASGPFEYDESWYLSEKIDALKEAMKNGQSAVKPAKDLLEEFKLIVSDYESITSKVTNKNLIDEIEQHLNAYKALGEAGTAAMEAIIASEEGNLELWMNSNSLAQEKLDLMETFKIESLESDGPKEYVVSVGTKLLKPLVKESMDYAKEKMGEVVLPKYDPEINTSLTNLKDVEVNFEDGIYSLRDLGEVTLNNGDYVGISLPKATKLRGINLLANNYDNIEIQYSINGLDWVTAKASTNENVLETLDVVDATFIRIINIGENSKNINLEKLEVLPVYKAEPTITENIGTHENYTIDKALDGNMDTKYWSNKPSDSGHNIQIDLGNVMPLYDINTYFGANDFMRNSEYMISEDGVNWTSLGALAYNSQDGKMVASANAEGKMARYIKIQSNGHNYGCWVEIYEIEFNKTAPEFDESAVNLASGTLEGNFNAFYDEDLSTAYEAKSVKDGDSLIYKMSRVTNISELEILQDKNRISEAKVIVKDLGGNWTEIGHLNAQINKLKVDNNITEVKFEFEGSKPAPKIYEIIAREREEQEEIVVSPVKEFKATTINKKNVTVSWEEPENTFGLESYILYKDGKKVSEISSDETSYTFKGLNRHTIYNFKIAAKYSNGEISKKESLTIRTAR